MSESVAPLGSRVLLEVLEEESVTTSGLVIPDTARGKQQKGIVAVSYTHLDVYKRQGPGWRP